MDSRFRDTSKLVVAALCASLFLASLSLALPESSTAPPKSAQINSNSVLVALLDSHYTELAELLEKALLLHTLEQAVGTHNLTIFAPKNEALGRDLDPEFKRFLLEPCNLASLQKLILFHFISIRVGTDGWQDRVSGLRPLHTLSHDYLHLSTHRSGQKTVEHVIVIHPDSITRPDGVIHGIERLLIPQSVQDDFNRRRSLRSIMAVKPEGAPETDPRTNRPKKQGSSLADKPGPPPALSISDAVAPAAGPSLAPASAPSPGGPHHHFDGETQVKDFIQTLLQYGGYNELADILVNLTSLATEMGKLVSEGYALTILAPNDEAMAKLTAEQLSEAGAPEQIMYYHMVPEYQTEESMYNAVRRFGKVRYETLRFPHKIVAEEADGSVKLGSGAGAAYLFDPDIYTDGRISLQGIDGVLFPAEEEKQKKTVEKQVKVPASSRGSSMASARRFWTGLSI